MSSKSNQLKAFISIQSYINNSPGKISTLGELSPHAFTFSKEHGYYQHGDLDDYKIITFTSINGDNLPYVLSQPLIDRVIEVTHHARRYLASRTPPHSAEYLRVSLYNNFINLLSNINIGVIIDDSNGSLPEWLSWHDVNTNTDVHIWLSTEAFENEYDDYEIVVVPPLRNLDDFFLPVNQSSYKIYEETIDKILVRANDYKNNYPETYLRAMRFNFVINSTTQIDTNWVVIIYGKYGDNIDSIKDAIIEYILEHSTRTRNEWENIFPDLFKRTEFIIIPRWDKMSIPNMLTSTGLYSQVVYPVECIDKAQTYIGFYTNQHIYNNVNIVPYEYKSIMLMIINGQFNIEGKSKFNELYSDYIAAPTTSLDFARMSLTTQEVVYSLSEMLLVAETMTAYSRVPETMRRIRRDNKLYLTRLIQNINFVMVPKVELIGD